MSKNNCKSFAESELELLSKTSTDPNDRPIIEEFSKELIVLCNKFGRSGQSGGSAPYTAGAICSALKKLLLFQPICPITGSDDEWGESVSNEKEMLQNKRCSAIFKENGQAYYLDAIVWQNINGNCFTGKVKLKDGTEISSFQNIRAFPFEPKTFYVKVDSTEINKDDWESFVIDEVQLEEVFKYYDKRVI